MDKIGDSFSQFRLTTPSATLSVQKSLQSDGQLQPVIVRVHGTGYELLDGFKRFYAAVKLQWGSLQCRIVDVDDITAKVMLLTCNTHNGGLEAYEQAGIVHNLKTEHLLDESQIARLLNKSISWVSRRLSFVERLDESVSSQLRLGQITSTHSRELARLPRGKQSVFLKLIATHGLTSRQTALLTGKYLQAKSAAEQEYLLSHPMEVIERAHLEADVHDCRLGDRGNRLLKTLRLLNHYQCVFINGCKHPDLDELPGNELKILSGGFRDVARNSHTIESILKSYAHER